MAITGSSARRPSSDSDSVFPQTFRLKRLSSDVSEDGNTGSRRSSLSEGHPPTVRRSSTEGSLNRMPGGTRRVSVSDGVLTVAGPPTVLPEQAGSQGTANVAISNVVVTPISMQKNIFEMAFAKKLAEEQGKKLVEGPARSPEFQPTPASPVVRKPSLPPLRLINPTADSAPVYPTQQPPLSPMHWTQGTPMRTTPRMPILSPLRTPTPPRQTRPVAQFHVVASPIVSPPWKDIPQPTHMEQIISPTQTVPVSPIRAHPTGALVSPIAVHPSALVAPIRAPQPAAPSGSSTPISTVTPQPVQPTPSMHPPFTSSTSPPTTTPTLPPITQPPTKPPTLPPITQPPTTPSTPITQPPSAPSTLPPITHPPTTPSTLPPSTHPSPTTHVPKQPSEPPPDRPEKPSQPEVPGSPQQTPLKQFHIAVEKVPVHSPPSVSSSSSSKAESSPLGTSETEPTSPITSPANRGDSPIEQVIPVKPVPDVASKTTEEEKASDLEVSSEMREETPVELLPPKLKLKLTAGEISPEVPRLPSPGRELVSQGIGQKGDDSEASEQEGEESSEESDESEDEGSTGSEVESQEVKKECVMTVVEGSRIVLRGRGVKKEEEKEHEIETVSLIVSWPKHLVPSLRKPEDTSPTLLTKAEVKADPSFLRSQRPPSLSITSGPVMSVQSLVAPSPPSTPSPTVEVEPPQPLLVSISRRTLRFSKFSLPTVTPTEERVKGGTSAEKVKLRLASFGIQRVNKPPTPIPGSEERVSATPSPTPPPVLSRKRELDISEMGLLGNAHKRLKTEAQVYTCICS